MQPSVYEYKAEVRGKTFARIVRTGSGGIRVEAMQQRFVALNGTARYEAWSNIEVRCQKRSVAGVYGEYTLYAERIVAARVVQGRAARFTMPVFSASCNRGDRLRQAYVTSAVGREDFGGPANMARGLTEFAF